LLLTYRSSSSSSTKLAKNRQLATKSEHKTFLKIFNRVAFAMQKKGKMLAPATSFKVQSLQCCFLQITTLLANPFLLARLLAHVS